MKKKITMSLAIILVVAIFAIVNVLIGREVETDLQKANSKTAYYENRVEKESKAWQKATHDSDCMRERLERNFKDIAECRKHVRNNLQYIMTHFEELKKGKEAEISVTAKLSYSSAYIYYLALYSDYNQKVYTEKEAALRKGLAYTYADRIFDYLLLSSSNTQEKADLLKAESLARKLERNLDEEVEKFVDCLVDVIEEGTQ